MPAPSENLRTVAPKKAKVPELFRTVPFLNITKKKVKVPELFLANSWKSSNNILTFLVKIYWRFTEVFGRNSRRNSSDTLFFLVLRNFWAEQLKENSGTFFRWGRAGPPPSLSSRPWWRPLPRVSTWRRWRGQPGAPGIVPGPACRAVASASLKGSLKKILKGLEYLNIKMSHKIESRKDWEIHFE